MSFNDKNMTYRLAIKVFGVFSLFIVKTVLGFADYLVLEVFC